MDHECTNIYKRARKSAHLTQEGAAEALGISVDSIKKYETGVHIPSFKVVDNMAACYNTQWLYALHSRQASQGMEILVPDFDPDIKLSQAVCDLISRVYAFADKHNDRRLLSIAADNVISDEEQDDFSAIMNELQGIIQAAMIIRCTNGVDTDED